MGLIAHIHTVFPMAGELNCNFFVTVPPLLQRHNASWSFDAVMYDCPEYVVVHQIVIRLLHIYRFMPNIWSIDVPHLATMISTIRIVFRPLCSFPAHHGSATHTTTGDEVRSRTHSGPALGQKKRDVPKSQRALQEDPRC